MIIRYIHINILYGLIASSSYSNLGAYDVTGTSTFVSRLMTDGGVLGRARAIYLARILCRADIVVHLQRHGRNVRTGQLPAHMRAVFIATERSLLGLRPAEANTRATNRHSQTGVTREQRVFVWAAGVDAYLTAARLAGHNPGQQDLIAYHTSSLRFGRAFDVDGNGAVSVEQIEALAERLMGRVAAATVLPGGWVNLMQVTNADWFRRDSTATQAEVIRAIETALPAHLVAALRRN